MGLHHGFYLGRKSIAATFLSIAFVACLVATVSAQEIRKITDSDTDAVEPAESQLDQREQLFLELARDVAELERRGNILKRVVRLAKPAVVHIDARTPQSLTGTGKSAEEAGSGVIIEFHEKQYVMTNRHVIKNAPLNYIKIRLHDGRVLFPTKLWFDSGTDIAVMAVAGNDLTSARLGKSKGLEIGDFVLAVGSPFGLSHSVTYGIISAKGRRDLRLGDDSVRFQDFLQTDAAINPGNSGGPLLNLRGEVIGINTAIATNSGGNDGIGFTIPIDMAWVVMQQLIENGRVVRAFLGVNLDSKYDAAKATQLGLKKPEGALISGITPNSPAEAANLHIGDVILQFDNLRVEDDNHLVNQVSLTPVGKAVSVVILRNGKPYSLNVKVGDRDKFRNER